MSTQRNLVANFLGHAWAAVMAIAFIPLYIQYLGMDAYGLIGFFSLMQAWLNVLDMGLSPALSREMARYTAGQHSRQEIGEIFSSVEMIFLLLAASIGGLVMLGSGAIANSWLGDSHLEPVALTNALSIAGWIIAFRWMAGLYKGAINGLQEQVWLNICLAGFATFRAVGVLGVLYWISPSIGAFFLFQTVATLVEALVLRWKLNRFLSPPAIWPAFNWHALQKVWKFAGGMTLITLLATLLTQADKLVLSKMLPLADFGHYALASSLALTTCALAALVFNAIYPRFTALAAVEQTDILTEQYHRYAQLLSVLTIPPALVLTVFADRVVFAWTGDQGLTESVAPLLSVLALGALFNAVMHIPYALQLAHGWTGYAVIVNFISVLFLVPATYWGVMHIGAMAAAIAWMTLNAGYILLGMPFMHRRLLPKELAAWYRNDLGFPLLAGVTVAGMVFYWAGADAFGPRSESLMVVMLAGIACGLAVAASTPFGRECLMRAYGVAVMFGTGGGGNARR